MQKEEYGLVRELFSYRGRVFFEKTQELYPCGLLGDLGCRGPGSMDQAGLGCANPVSLVSGQEAGVNEYQNKNVLLREIFNVFVSWLPSNAKVDLLLDSGYMCKTVIQAWTHESP